MEIYHAFIFSTLTGFLLSKVDDITPILFIILMKLFRFNYLELNIPTYQNFGANDILQWIKKNGLFSTKTTIGFKKFKYGIIFLKKWNGILYLRFSEIGYEDSAIYFSGYVNQSTLNEINKVLSNIENEDSEKEESKIKKEETIFLENEDYDLKKNEKEDETKDLKKEEKQKIYTLKTLVKKGPYKNTTFKQRHIKITSIYDQYLNKSMDLPDYLNEQYNAIEKIKHVFHQKKVHGYPQNLKVMLSGVPGSGKSWIVYELAKDLENCLITIDYSPVDPGNELQTLISECKNMENKTTLIILINEFDIIYDKIEKEKIHFHKECRTEITHMSKLLDYLDMISLLDNIIFIFTTNRDLSYFPERILRKGRMDLLLEFKENISEKIIKDF